MKYIKYNILEIALIAVLTFLAYVAVSHSQPLGVKANSQLGESVIKTIQQIK